MTSNLPHIYVITSCNKCSKIIFETRLSQYFCEDCLYDICQKCNNKFKKIMPKMDKCYSCSVKEYQ